MESYRAFMEKKLFIIFMFHKRYKDSRQITCVKLAIDFADL